jgi:hypothetical protein
MEKISINAGAVIFIYFCSKLLLQFSYAKQAAMVA